MILCSVVLPSELRACLGPLPQAPLPLQPTPVEPLARLRAAIGARPTLLIKRDDAMAFGFGGNKIRKLVLVAGRALAEGADTLITCGGVQSNHMRATAAAAAKLGMRCALVANGIAPDPPTANALLDRLLGADVHVVPGREDRTPAMERLAERARADGHRPFIIPLGASTPTGALAYALAIAELAEQIEPPDVIVHATSSGGTQAGLLAGCRALGWPTRIIGISADESPASLAATIAEIHRGMAALVPDLQNVLPGAPVEVDDRFIGDGYGLPTPASREAQELAAREEAIFVDHTYTAKAMAGVIAACRDRSLDEARTVLFWHTGGQVGLFA
jgi:L-cysteate sulfo-lyase